MNEMHTKQGAIGGAAVGALIILVLTVGTPSMPWWAAIAIGAVGAGVVGTAWAAHTA